MFHSHEVIGHKCPAHFAIDSITFFLSCGVTGGHTSETKVNGGEAFLTRLHRHTNQMRPSRNHCLLCLDACGTLVENFGTPMMCSCASCKCLSQGWPSRWCHGDISVQSPIAHRCGMDLSTTSLSLQMLIPWSLSGIACSALLSFWCFAALSAATSVLTAHVQTLMNEMSFVWARLKELQKVAAGSLTLTSGRIRG